jgi:PAS domain S-box-containing protein
VLVDSPVNSILLVNPDGIILETNQTFAQRIGRRVDELIGMNVYDFLPPDLAKSRRARVDEIVHFGVHIRFEDERAGMQLDHSAHPIFDAQGKVTRIAIVARDVTERKRADEALRRKSGEQALLLDNIQTQVWYLTDEETYGAVNKARAEFFWKKNGEMENKKLYDVLSKNEAEICMSGYVEVFEKRKQIHTEEWITNAKGEKRLLSIIKSPKLDENGDVEYVVCSAEDITERKRAEEALKTSKELFEKTFISQRVFCADSF